MKGVTAAIYVTENFLEKKTVLKPVKKIPLL